MATKIENILDIGAFILDVRRQHGLTQSQVAFVTKVERSLINKLENGKVEGITLHTVNKLIKGLNHEFIIAHK